MLIKITEGNGKKLYVFIKKKEIYWNSLISIDSSLKTLSCHIVFNIPLKSQAGE